MKIDVKGKAELYVGNAIDVLKTFKPETVNCSMSSPPYCLFNLALDNMAVYPYI